jgi:hypothetical protein
VRNGSLHQVVPVAPSPNSWINDPDPITLLGDATPWLNVSVGVTAAFANPGPQWTEDDTPPATLAPCDGSLSQVRPCWAGLSKRG